MMDEDEIEALTEFPKVISFTHEAKKRGKPCGCLHQRFIVDQQHGSVTCAECEEPVSAFHALCATAKAEGMLRRQYAALKAGIAEMQKHTLLKAVRALDRMWRGGRMVPCCPHCGKGIFAEELANGTKYGTAIEQARRSKENREKGTGK